MMLFAVNSIHRGLRSSFVYATVVMKSRRHSVPLSDQDVNTLSEKYVPQHTAFSTTWAVNTFFDWMRERNESPGTMKCPTDLLSSSTIGFEILDYWLAAFILEVKKGDGSYYTYGSLRNLIAGIGRQLRQVFGAAKCPHLLDKDVTSFPRLTNALDRQGRFLRKAGIGAETKHCSVFDAELENKLWVGKVLGTHSSKALLNTVFF